jgi:hypothetical protein
VSGFGDDDRASVTTANHDTLGSKRETDMKLRLGFGVALLAVLFGVWVLLSKPSCLTGYRASFAPPAAWTCVAE